jgi:hypothetical protein
VVARGITPVTPVRMRNIKKQKQHIYLRAAVIGSLTDLNASSGHPESVAYIRTP